MWYQKTGSSIPSLVLGVELERPRPTRRAEFVTIALHNGKLQLVGAALSGIQ